MISSRYVRGGSFLMLLIAAILFPTFTVTAQPGNADPSFLTGTGFNNTVKMVHVLPNGKMYVVGYFTTYKGSTQNYIVRLNADGTLDTTFDTVSVGSPPAGQDQVNSANGNIEAIAVQSDGKILIGGSFTSFQGVIRNRIARLNTDGSLDYSFNTGLGIRDTDYGFESLVTRILIQPDGKIVVTGFFQTYNTVTRQRIVRLNTNGAVDQTFDSSRGANGNINTMELQPDGKILIGGFFTAYGGVARFGIARINSNGSLDATFNPGTGTNDLVSDIALRSDGKIYVAGSFTKYNETARNYIALVNANGSLDLNTFPNGQGTNGAIFMAKILGNRLFLGGNFSNFAGNNVNSMVVLLADQGSFDGNYPHGLGFNDDVLDVGLSSGNYVFVGKFTMFSVFTHNRIVRVSTTYPAPTITTISPFIFTNETTRPITFDINGTNFFPNSTTVDPLTDGLSITSTQYISQDKLRVTATLTAGAPVGPRAVTVRNPSPGGGAFRMVSGIRVAYPTPSLSSVSPNNLFAGNVNRSLTIIGTNFNRETTLSFGSNAIQVNSVDYVSPTQLLAIISIGNQAPAGTVTMTVTNPSTYGVGGTSNALNFTINLSNPVPTLSSITPNAVNQGKTVLVKFTGTNFLTNSTIGHIIQGISILDVQRESSTVLWASISAASTASLGAHPMWVINPQPGGGGSNALTFNVLIPENPVPTLTSINPSSFALGSTTSVTITGTQFMPNTSLSISGTGVNLSEYSVVSSTQINVKFLLSGQALPGARSLTVVNPAPGGGTSNALSMTVQSNRPPTLNTINNIQFLHTAPLQTIPLSGITMGEGEGFQSLSVTATADDPLLIPTLNVEYVSPQSTGQLKLLNDRKRVGSTLIRVKVKDNGGTIGGGVDSLVRVFQVNVNLDTDLQDPTETPLVFDLAQNYPNPFNPSTTVQFTMQKSEPVRIQLYNAMGVLLQTLVNEVRTAGVHRLQIDAEHLPSGIYFYHMQTASGYRQSRKMTLIK